MKNKLVSKKNRKNVKYSKRCMVSVKDQRAKMFS